MAKIMFLIFGIVSSILITQALPTTTNEALPDPPFIETRGALLEIFGLGFLSLRAKCSEKIMRPSSILPNLGITLTRLNNNGVYYFSPVETAVTFTQARQFCVNHGMHLVTIDSVNENALLFARAKELGMTGTATAPGAWIGLRDSGANSWRWASNNLPSSLWYFNTAVTAAAPLAGECANFIAETAVTDPAISWAGSACTDLNSFICELDYPCNKVVQATIV